MEKARSEEETKPNKIAINTVEDKKDPQLRGEGIRKRRNKNKWEG